MRRIRQWIAESSRQWCLSQKVATWIFWMPLVGAVVLVLARLDKELYRFLLHEDGVVEWAQFICFVVACVAGVGVARFRFRAGHPWQAALFLCLAVVMVFAAGEEISWGQRVLELQTPEYFQLNNKQDEISLHNIGSTLDVFKLAMLLAGATGAVAYLVNRKVHLQWYWDQADYLLIPPFFLASSFFFVFAYQLVRHTLLPTSGFTITRYGEWSEFCLAFAIAMFVGLNYWRLATDARRQVAVERISRHKSVPRRRSPR